MNQEFPLPNDNRLESHVELSKVPVSDLPDYSDQPPITPIVRSSAVAVGRFGDGVGAIWTGFVLNLTALFPLLVFLSSLGNPRYMATMGAWILISPVLIIGTLFSGSGVKEKGYQKESIRIFAVGSFFVGILFFFIPVVASIMYASGIGN